MISPFNTLLDNPLCDIRSGSNNTENQIMNTQMNWLSDPGHAWLKVPLTDLMKSGVVDKISQYSYLMGDYAYLEEDCDASIFLDAIGRREDKFPSFHCDEDCRIRNYLRYTPEMADRLFIMSKNTRLVLK